MVSLFEKASCRNSCINGHRLWELIDQNQFESQLVKELMLSVLSVLSKFSFLKIHPSVDIYAKFRFVPMPCLSLGVCRMWKECVVLMLRDDSRLNSVRCVSGNVRPLKYINRTVLSILNTFLKRCLKRSPGYSLKENFSKSGSRQRLTRLFNEGGLHGMLEASDFYAIENATLFLGAFVNSLCDLFVMA